MTPQLLAFSFVIGSVLLTWTIRALGRLALSTATTASRFPTAANAARQQRCGVSARNWPARLDRAVAANVANSSTRSRAMLLFVTGTPNQISCVT